MTLDYRNPMHADAQPPRTSWKVIVAWTLGPLALLLLIALLLPSRGRARETAKRVKCASNLRQIAQAALLYANDHGGQLPPDLVALHRHLDGDITPELFACPSSAIEKASGATTEQIAASMLAGDHLSYAWTGAGLTPSSAGNIVIAFDFERHVPKDGARGTGINVLFNDGSVQFVDEQAARTIHAQFLAGVRPILLPNPSAPTTTSSPPATTSRSGP